MVIRSGGMGEFVFTPPGIDEQLIREAGFDDVRVEDVTENPTRVAMAWHTARAQHAAELDELEGAEQNAVMQEFLATVAGSPASAAFPASPTSHAALKARTPNPTRSAALSPAPR